MNTNHQILLLNQHSSSLKINVQLRIGLPVSEMCGIMTLASRQFSNTILTTKDDTNTI